MSSILDTRSIQRLGMAIVACILIPAILFWLVVASQPGILPEAVAGRLAAGAALIDLRTDPGDTPLSGAERIPVETLLAVPAADALPASLAGRQLILVSDGGMRAAQATAHLRSLGLPALRLEGGTDAWRCAAATMPEGATPFPKTERSEATWKQGLVIISGLVVKPIYMLMTLLLALGLRTATGHGSVAIRRALWLFLFGETACAINLIFFHEASVLLDYLHGWGMALAVSAAAWGVLARMLCPPANAGMRCAWEEVCQPCTRPGRCRGQRILPLLPLLVLVAAAVPLSAGLATIATTATIAGQPYAYRHELPQVLFELRVLPLCTVFLAGVGLVMAMLGRSAIALAWTALAVGPLSFSLLRLLLGGVWQDDPAWFLAWEEFGELATLVALWWGLAVFRSPPAGTRSAATR